MEGWALQQLARIIYKNKESLKVLKMSTSLLSVLPRGLKLEKFSTTTQMSSRYRRSLTGRERIISDAKENKSY